MKRRGFLTALGLVAVAPKSLFDIVKEPKVTFNTGDLVCVNKDGSLKRIETDNTYDIGVNSINRPRKLFINWDLAKYNYFRDVN